MIKYTEIEEKAIDIVMEQLPIVIIVIDYLQSEEHQKIMAAIRLIGNISSHEHSDYVEHFFKNNLLEALVIGWNRISPSVEVDKEVGWVLSNIVASNS